MGGVVSPDELEAVLSCLAIIGLTPTLLPRVGKVWLLNILLLTTTPAPAVSFCSLLPSTRIEVDRALTSKQPFT